MTNRIDFPPESFDHILFERELLEKEIKYVKSEGILFRFTQTVSFLFEEKDYQEAVKVAEAFPSTLIRRNYLWFNRGTSISNPGITGNDKFQKLFFLILLIVFCVAFIVTRIYK
jgi:hypothetical protein